MYVLFFLFVEEFTFQNAFRVLEQNEFSSSESPSRASRPHWVVRLIKQHFSNSLTCPSSHPRSPFDKLIFHLVAGTPTAALLRPHSLSRGWFAQGLIPII
ncbi:hypothetical protein ISCGN_013525 [Ixodes scapularis]